MLETLFGKTPIVKVIDFFLQHRGYDYTKDEIMKNAGISRGTFYSSVWGHLRDLELVEESRHIGNATLYKLNQRNPIVEKLDYLDIAISHAVNLKLTEEGKQKIGTKLPEFKTIASEDPVRE